MGLRVNGDNPVGVEYMIMEMVQGKSPVSRWLSLSSKELAEVIRRIVKVGTRLFSARFARYGSLYYKEDLEEEFRKDEPGDRTDVGFLSGKFRIGLIVTTSFGQRSGAKSRWTADRVGLPLNVR